LTPHFIARCCDHPFLFPGAEEDPDETPLEELVGASGKLRVLDRMLVKLHAKDHRVVLFSQFSSMVDLLDDYCRQVCTLLVRVCSHHYTVGGCPSHACVRLPVLCAGLGDRRRTPPLLLPAARLELRPPHRLDDLEAEYAFLCSN